MPRQIFKLSVCVVFRSSYLKSQQATAFYQTGRWCNILALTELPPQVCYLRKKPQNDSSVCGDLINLEHEALQNVYVPIRENGLGLSSNNDIKGASYIGCLTLVLRRVAAVSARENLPSLLQQPSKRSMVSLLLEDSGHTS